jgi:pteridine reductase
MNQNWFYKKNQSLFETDNPVALVTGSASNRVGRQIGQLLMDRHFRVAFHSHQSKPQDQEYVLTQQRQGREAMLVSGAVESEKNIASWLEVLKDNWGRVDLVVNSAAVWDPKCLSKTSIEDVRRHWEVNVLGTFLVSQKFGLEMAGQRSGGAIIQIGDWAVARPYTEFSAYFLSKGSIETMTRSLAVELACRNPRMRVNAVLPGPVMLADSISEQRQKEILEDCLLKRHGTAEDVAEAVYFLATSPFITGVCIPVDGGRTIYGGTGRDSVAHPKM